MFSQLRRMRGTLTLLVLLAAAQPGEGQVLQVDVDLVNIYVTVSNTKGRVIADIDRESFTVLEDGRPQHITNFSREIDVPLTMVMVLDTSGSVREKLRFEKDAAMQFLQATLRPGRDKAAVFTFDTKLELTQDFTDDTALLAQGVARPRAGGGTRLYDALYVVLSEKLSGPEDRKVIILVTDGDDNSSRHSVEEVVELAQRNNVSIYAVSTNRTGIRWPGSNENDGVIGMLSAETGGRAFFPDSVKQLGAHFVKIGNELRSQYSIAYRSTNSIKDGSFRRIQIDVKQSKYVVRARSGYYAPQQVAVQQR